MTDYGQIIAVTAILMHRDVCTSDNFNHLTLWNEI